MKIKLLILAVMALLLSGCGKDYQSAFTKNSSSQPDGYKVGVNADLLEGEYVLFGKGSFGIWNNGKLSLSENVDGLRYIVLRNHEIIHLSGDLKISREKDSASFEPPTTPTSGSYQYKIGKDIAAGTYKLYGDDGARAYLMSGTREDSGSKVLRQFIFPPAIHNLLLFLTDNI